MVLILKRTETIKASDITFNAKIKNREKVVKKFLNTSFKNFKFKPISDADAGHEYIAILQQAQEALLLKETCIDMRDLQQQLDQIFFNINKIQQVSKPTALFIRGSFNTHAGMLVYYATRATTQEDFVRCYEIGRDTYNQFMRDAIASLSADPLMLDDTVAIA